MTYSDMITVADTNGVEQRIGIDVTPSQPNLIQVEVQEGEESDTVIALQLSSTEVERLIAKLSTALAAQRLMQA